MRRARTNTLALKTPEGVTFALPLASPVSRFLAWTVDAAAIVASGGLLRQALSLIHNRAFAQTTYIIAYFVVSIGYGIGLEWFWRGQTLGKRVLGLRVMDEQALRLELSQIVVRNLLRFVDMLPLAYMIGGIASGGDYHRPHLVFKDQLLALGAAPDKPAQDFPLSPETVAAVKSGMWAVVNEGGGTGAGARCPEVEVSGKTGTAQVVSTQLQKSSANAEFKTNAWFVGYGPTDKPEIVVAALVLHGGHSTAAVPVVRDVIKAYFDKKAGPKPPANQMESQVRVLSQLQTVPAQVEAAPAKRR